MKHPRLLIGLSEVAGHYKGLKLGFQRLGLKCTFINLSEHSFGFDLDDQIWPIRQVQKTDTKRRKAKNPVSKILFSVLQFFLQSILFFRLLPHHDIYIYCANRSFMAFLDLPILKLFGKKIIYQMHGCDSRAPYLDGAYNKGKLLPLKSLYKATYIKKKVMRITERYADIVVNIPPQAQLCEKRYINWLNIGLCCYPYNYPIVNDKTDNKKNYIRVLHCPSRPEAKGTPIIRKSVEKLIKKGLKIDYIELSGVPNIKVIEEISRADLIVDQVYADYAMPGLATEAAWLSKPVLVCGYASTEWKKWMNPVELPPTYYCHPDELDTALFQLVTNKDLRSQVAREMHEFVSKYWKPEQIAKNYLRALFTPPDNWWLSPGEATYLHGCCISESNLRQGLSDYISKYGAKGLQLADKQGFSDRIRNFAKTKPNHNKVAR
ncbi:hypothetical protein [Spongorhabdus nitratireducens]